MVERDPMGREDLLERDEMIGIAVDQRAVEIEQKGGHGAPSKGTDSAEAAAASLRSKVASGSRRRRASSR